ncbi:class I SAM-dependent methyltransferase [Paenibacillus lautus]|uniref:class I SAM-dependent methyltransferase n=1 Tax=Paenibacillus lautus TaxID=1401 RepID=UPI001C7DD432|nr:class I SAM-dependent methyltransferase [Paenibacillus lautus]MBX4148123.1 class I SAM-dependent methyltransferase [Paenibacillus lautus]
MKQNKYDDQGFFENYNQLPRSIKGLEGAGEWGAFRSMFPDLSDKKVLDLGCGFGWHCRYVREQHARSVVGVDISRNMLERARLMTDDTNIEYVQSAIEDYDYPANEFDVVISSLALHYIRDFEDICKKVYQSLTVGGSFVFSVEHPVFTAVAEQDWYYSPDGKKLHWPLDHYHDEGGRQSRFLDHDVTKYHRNIATQINALVKTGFQFREMSELKPEREQIEDPEWHDALRRPIFLLIAADKQV